MPFILGLTVQNWKCCNNIETGYDGSQAYLKTQNLSHMGQKVQFTRTLKPVNAVITAKFL